MPEGRPKTASDVVQNMDKTRTQALLEILESGQGLHFWTCIGICAMET